MLTFVQARSFGCQTVDLSDATQPLTQQLQKIVGKPEVDCAIDCVGFEARGCGNDHTVSYTRALVCACCVCVLTCVCMYVCVCVCVCVSVRRFVYPEGATGHSA